MDFYLGTHMPNWCERWDVPMFISHVRLKRYKRIPHPICRVAVDSGGFSEIAQHGKFLTTPEQYVTAIARYVDAMGRSDGYSPGITWAAPQDWMCEDAALARTGLTVGEHQNRTLANYLELRNLDATLPFIPVIQGQTLGQYRRHVDKYARHGLDLTDKARFPIVGIGSVCRRQSTLEIRSLVVNLALDGLSLHGFGMKADGLAQVGDVLTSADSMAWSFQARKRAMEAEQAGLPTVMPGCRGHRTCANCPRYAMAWRKATLDAIGGKPAQLVFGGVA